MTTDLEPVIGQHAIGQQASGLAAADPSAADPSAADPSAADPSAAGPTVEDPTVADPVATADPIADPSAADLVGAEVPAPGSGGLPVAPPYDAAHEDSIAPLVLSDEAPASSRRVHLGGEPLVPAIAPVGFVDASADATTKRSWLVLDDDADVALDEFVVAAQRLTDGVVLFHYGIVVEAAGRVEGAESPTATRWINAATMPGVRARRVEVAWLRTVPERFLPPLPGAAVWRAEGEHRVRALYLDQMDADDRLPLGLDLSGRPVYCDYSFVNGDKGGHVSISGKSGVATKTSYALFLLYLLFETAWAKVRGRGAASDRAVVFCVKGEDLLHLDRDNTAFAAGTERGDTAREQWRALDVADPRPFRNVRFFAPRAEGDGGGTHTANVRTRDRTAVTVYGWTPWELVTQGLLGYVIDDLDTGQIAFVEQVVRLQLLRYAFPLAGDTTGKVVFADPDSVGGVRVPNVWAKAAKVAKPALTAADGTVVADFAELCELVADKVVDGNPGYDPRWIGGVGSGTVQAFVRRLWAAEPRLRPVVGAGLHAVDLGGAISVVDIHALHDAAQRFVVAALLSRVWSDHEHGGHAGTTWVLLDELNKYAPRQGRSPIKDLLVDIAGRGRSLGVLLLGAQQNPSGVDVNVTANAALHVVGQIRAQEAAELGFLGSELRERAQLVAPGTMITSQPLIPTPIPVRFPFPPYATRVAEVDRRDTLEHGNALLEGM